LSVLPDKGTSLVTIIQW